MAEQLAAIRPFEASGSPTMEEFNLRIEQANAALGEKQPRLTGAVGQVVGFDAAGKAVAQPAPGVTSFKGRTGAVVPQSGDYTAAQVGAIPMTMADSFAKKSDVAGAYIYRGSVATYESLPTEGLTAGDVYNVEANNMNYGWTGTGWDPLGQIFQIEYLTPEEVDAIMEQSDTPSDLDKPLDGAGLAQVNEIINGRLGTKLPTSGGTVTGPLTAQKKLTLGASGEVFDILYPAAVGYFRWLTLRGNSITLADRDDTTKPISVYGIAAPTDPTGAANKKYVDDLVGDIASVLDAINGDVV